MKFIKNNLKIVIGFTIGVILASSISVYATYLYNATDVGYKNASVSSALDDLYNKVKTETTGVKIDNFILKPGNNYYELGFKPSLVFFKSNNVWGWFTNENSTYYAATVSGGVGTQTNVITIDELGFYFNFNWSNSNFETTLYAIK